MLVHPGPFVPVTVYVVVVLGLTEAEAVLSPVVQLYVFAPVAVRVADWPSHIVTELAVTFGAAVIVTFDTAVFWQPFASVPVTVYEVLEVGLTEMFAPVPPELHEYELAPLAVKLTATPEQVDGELTVTAGRALTVILNVCGEEIQPAAEVAVPEIVPVVCTETDDAVKLPIFPVPEDASPIDEFEFVQETVPVEAVKLGTETEAPEQTAVEVIAVNVGSGFTVTVTV